MDNFLTKLFHEEQEKVASAELGTFMNQLPREDLEDFLGIGKIAVEGSQIPPMPDSMPPKALTDLQAEKQKYVDQEHAGTPKSVDKQPEGVTTGVKYSGDGKEATGKTAEDAAAEKVAWADRAGRFFAKQAACAMTKTDEFTNSSAKAKAKAFSATLKASKGQPLATRKAALQGTEKAIEKKGGTAIEVGPWAPPLDPELGEQRGRQAGGVLGGLAGGLSGATAGAGLASHFAPGSMSPRDRLLATVLAGGAGALGGGALGVLGGRALGGYGGRKSSEQYGEKVRSDLAAIDRLRGGSAGSEKESMGMPESEGAGMETTAAVKAKIASMALKVSAGAPEHIKAAAVFMAGREIAKLAR